MTIVQITKNANAGLYIRVSTEHQAKEGYSVAAQKTNLINFANNNGWNIYDIYADEGISGKNITGRPEVNRLINDIKNKKIDVVVLYKFDRLTRNSKDTEDVIDLIQDCGIKVVTLSGGTVDVSSATGRFSVRISGALAQLEREQTIERVKIAFKQKAQEGYSLACATNSYGYTRKQHEKELIIDKEESRIVKRVFKMYADGKSFTQICNILNVENIPTKQAGRKIKKRNSDDYYIVNSVWMPKTIRLMLTNVTYIGKIRYHIGQVDEAIFDGNHEPIIIEKLWNKVQEKIDKIHHVSKTILPKDDVYYCGTLVCGICGKKLTTNRTVRAKKNGSIVKFNGYRCVNREKKMCTCLGVSHRKVEAAFIDYIDKIEDLTEIENIEIDENIDENNELLDSLKKTLLQSEKKKKEIMNLFMNDKLSHEEMKYMKSVLDDKTKELTSEIERLKRLIRPQVQIDKSEIAKKLKEHWNNLSNKEKLEFLTNFVESITIVNRDRDKINGKPEILEVKFYER